jgi:hypothetical protein
LGRRRIRLFHKLEVKCFSFYVVTEKKHEREIETLLIHAAGVSCETIAWLFKTTAPLTRDIVKAGMTSAVADSSRMKRELLPRLAYPTLSEGISLL